MGATATAMAAQQVATAHMVESPAASAESAALARAAALEPASEENPSATVEIAVEEAAEDLPKEDWFVGVNGVPLGPIPLVDLCELAAAGHVDRRSLVWRERYEEWKPLGKLPDLLRVVERVVPPSEAPSGALAPPAPGAALSNGAASANKATNGASVRLAPVGIPRPGAEAKAPASGYTDLEDEDDEEEQPTTVKGRVSAPPSDAAPPPVPPLIPQALIPQALTPQALTAPGTRTTTTTQVRAVPLMPPPPGVAPSAAGAPGVGVSAGMFAGGAPGGMASPSSSSLQGGAVAPLLAGAVPPPPAALGAAPLVLPPIPLSSSRPAIESASAISSTSDPLVDERSTSLLVGRRRKSRGLIWLAVAGAFALGVGLTLTYMARFTQRSESEADGAPKKALSSASERAKPSEPPPPPPASEDPDKPADHADEGVEITDGPLPQTAPNRSTGSGKPQGAAAQESGQNPGLLAGLNRLQEPAVSGPSTEPVARNTGGGGLDAAAIQATVGRYRPSVQRGCWQPALSARAPNAPTSAKVSMSMTVDGSGRVTSVSTGGDPRGYPGLARCIESRVRAWRFPRSSGVTSVAVPFVFAAQ